VNSRRSAREIGVPAVADYPPGAEMRARVIDDHEFVWMLRGEALLVTGDEELALSPGRLLLVPPGARHRFVWDRARASRHGYVHFRPDEGAFPKTAEVRSRRMTEHDPQAGLCAYLLWLGREQPDGWEDAVRRTLAFLTALFLSAALPGDTTGTALPHPLAAAVHHLRRAWAEMPLRRVGVADLSAAASVSRSYLGRRFRAELGTSPSEALEALRCSRAETLLVHTDMTIASIARQCGFADVYHFSHRFSRRYGVAPTGYRQARGAGPSALDHPGLRVLANAVWA
jgi:AraC-like DNA-binding protein